MIRRFFRGAFIVWVVLRYGLDELVLSGFDNTLLALLRRIVSVGRDQIGRASWRETV